MGVSVDSKLIITLRCNYEVPLFGDRVLLSLCDQRERPRLIDRHIECQSGTVELERLQDGSQVHVDKVVYLVVLECML